MLISSIFLVSLNSHLEPDTPRARPDSIRSSQTKPKTFFTMLVRMERGRAPTLSMEIEGACNPECCWKGAWKWSSMDGQTNQATALMKLYLKPFSSGLLLHEPINVCGLKITDNIKCIGKDMERLELIYCWWENKLKQLHWNIYCHFLAKLNILFMTQPFHLYLIYSRQMDTYLSRDSYINFHKDFICIAKTINSPNIYWLLKDKSQ